MTYIGAVPDTHCLAYLLISMLTFRGLLIEGGEEGEVRIPDTHHREGVARTSRWLLWGEQNGWERRRKRGGGLLKTVVEENRLKFSLEHIVAHTYVVGWKLLTMVILDTQLRSLKCVFERVIVLFPFMYRLANLLEMNEGIVR